MASGLPALSLRCSLRPYSLSPSFPALFHFKHKAFEVFGFRQIEDDGMVGSGAAALEEAHATRGIGGSRS